MRREAQKEAHAIMEEDGEPDTTGGKQHRADDEADANMFGIGRDSTSSVREGLMRESLAQYSLDGNSPGGALGAHENHSPPSKRPEDLE